MHVQLDRANAAHEFMREYMELVTRTKAPRQYIDDITHMALGLTTEAGEVADIVKKSVFYKDTKAEAADSLWKQKEHMGEELGDVLWYIAGMAQDYGLDLVTIMQDNIKKLQVRYPDKFKSAHANLRDPVAEAIIFNQVASRPPSFPDITAPGTISNVAAYTKPEVREEIYNDCMSEKPHPIPQRRVREYPAARDTDWAIDLNHKMYCKDENGNWIPSGVSPTVILTA